MHAFTTRRKIEFADTDMGGIVHFSRFVVFMETAEHQFLESLGSCVHTEIDGVAVGWPRVSVRCEYHGPARFGDELEIRLTVLRKGTSSMRYGFEFYLGSERIAEGKMTSVCCELVPGNPPRSIPIPAAIADKVEQAPTR